MAQSSSRPARSPWPWPGAQGPERRARGLEPGAWAHGPIEFSAGPGPEPVAVARGLGPQPKAPMAQGPRPGAVARALGPGRRAQGPGP